MKALVRTWRHLDRKHVAVAIAGGIVISLSTALSTLHLNLFRKYSEVLYHSWWYVPMVATFVLAVVIVEANAPRKRPSFRAYVAAALVATTLCMAGAYVAGPSLKMTGRRHVPGFEKPNYYLPIHARTSAIFALGFEGVMHCVLGMFVYVRLRNARFTAMALARTQKLASEAASVAASVRLASARDRIDPVALTRTLEDIERLYGTDPPRAEAQLDELIEVLRAAISLGRRREESAARGARETLASAAE